MRIIIIAIERLDSDTRPFHFAAPAAQFCCEGVELKGRAGAPPVTSALEIRDARVGADDGAELGQERVHPSAIVGCLDRGEVASWHPRSPLEFDERAVALGRRIRGAHREPANLELPNE